MLHFMIYVMPWVMLGIMVLINIPWRFMFERLWGNNPDKASVEVEYGDQVIPCKGKKIANETTPAVTTYQYKCRGEMRTVMVEAKYPYRYIMGRRQVRVIGENSEAAPLGDYKSPGTSVSGQMLNIVLQANIGSSLVKSIFGKAISIMTILIILGILAFGGYYVYRNVLQPNQENAPAAQQAPAPAQSGPLE